MTQQQEWVLHLNRYQRDNLLWLLNTLGYPFGEGIEPFTLANTGDWVGEIGSMLAKTDRLPIIDERDNPNSSMDEIRHNIQRWLDQKRDAS